MVQPNLALNPDIRKAAYYLNGTFVGREYSAPFTLGGTAGFDTTKLADGTYTLGGAYTTRTGDKTFSITFTVKNSVFKAAAASPACTTSICGVTDGQTVSGVISVSPNLAQIPGVRKVAYYLNGVLLTREYKSPFTLGGAAGFDTTKLANGTYVLSGAYTTATGDVPFTMNITVKN